jgi:hypothetical protein
MSKHAGIDIKKLITYNIDDYFKILNNLLSQPREKDINFDTSNQAIF